MRAELRYKKQTGLAAKQSPVHRIQVDVGNRNRKRSNCERILSSSLDTFNHSERQSRADNGVLRPAAQKPLVMPFYPNPGSDPPPVTLARDTRKGLYREVEFHGREDLVPLIIKITGKGRSYA